MLFMNRYTSIFKDKPIQSIQLGSENDFPLANYYPPYFHYMSVRTPIPNDDVWNIIKFINKSNKI